MGWVPSDSFSAPRFSSCVRVRSYLGRGRPVPSDEFPTPRRRSRRPDRDRTAPPDPPPPRRRPRPPPRSGSGHYARRRKPRRSGYHGLRLLLSQKEVRPRRRSSKDLASTRVAGRLFQSFQPRSRGREGRAGGPRPAARREPTLQGGGLRGRGTPKASVRAGHGAVRTKQNVFVSLRVTARRHTTPPNPEVSV